MSDLNETTAPITPQENLLIHYRLADPNDLAVVSSFHRALYITARSRFLSAKLCTMGDYAGFRDMLNQDAETLLSDPTARVWLAEFGPNENPTAIGYISGRLRNDPGRSFNMRGTIEDWYVQPDFRNKGVGTTLYTLLRDDFAKRGCQVLESATWPSNTEACKLHDKLGFESYEVRYRLRLD